MKSLGTVRLLGVLYCALLLACGESSSDDPKQSNSGGAGASSGGAGATPFDDWSTCPKWEEPANPASWPHTLEVTDSAIYCSTFSEARTLKEELAMKAKLRFAPGSYPLPGENRDSFSLPVCVRPSVSAAPVGVAAGDLTLEERPIDEGQTFWDYRFDLPLTAPLAGSVRIWLQTFLPGTETPNFTLDGSESIQTGSFRALFWCETSDTDCFPDTLAAPVHVFDSCTHSGSRVNRHDLVLDSGDVSLELRISRTRGGTEAGAFVRANGTFRGTSFDQQDYFKLIYNPTHHHFDREFTVLWDTAIDGACGIEIAGLDEALGNVTPDAAYAVDCALERLETLSVESHVLTVGP